MKKIITLILFVILSANFVFAQNATIAKLKYEEAEEAYSANDYSLALTKLNEVEAMLKSTNPRVMYLKICSQSKLIEANPFNDFTLIENVRTLSAKYLKDYESLPDNEDKYRDIYKISEKLKSYPATLENFRTEINKKEDAANAKKTEEINTQIRYEENFKNYVYFKDLKLGLTLEETIKEYPRFKKYTKNSDPRITAMGCDYAIYSKEGLDPNGVQLFYVKNKIVIGYGYFGINVENTLNDLKRTFNFNPVITVKEEGFSSFFKSANTTNYTWKKNNKIIELTKMTVVLPNGGISVTTTIVSLDQNFSK